MESRCAIAWAGIGIPSSGARSTVLFFCGGNWRSDRRQDCRFVADMLIMLGCDVVIPHYCL